MLAVTDCSRKPPAAVDPQTSPRTVKFTDVTAHSGIAWSTTSGHSPSTQLVEVKGGGLALFDYDVDGDLDLFVPNGATLESPDRGPGCKLFENQGGLRFVDATARSGLSFCGWGMGVAIGDCDGDGFEDVYVAAFGKDALLRNRGDRTFEDVTDRAGLGDDRWSTGCAFGDLDGDGDLDLYVTNYVVFDPLRPPPPDRYRGLPVFGGPIGLAADADSVYENLGDGRFRDRSQSSGILAVKPSYGLGVAIIDFDADGRQDVFVGNDSMPSFLFHNDGNWHFTDVGVHSGIALSGDGAAQATMGIAIGDVNGDLEPDVYTTNFADDTNTLHVSVPGGLLFDDRTRQYGLGAATRPFLGWASWFCDFDQDGDEDVIVFNGHVYPQATISTLNSSYRQTPLLFEREADHFERVLAQSAGAWLAEQHCDRAAVFGDLDQDDDVDIVVAELNGPLRILRNDSGGHGLIVELDDRRAASANRRGLGARIVLTEGGRKQVRWVFSGGSFQASSPACVHFGLASERKVTLDILWPDGISERVDEVAPDQHRIVTRNDP